MERQHGEQLYALKIPADQSGSILWGIDEHTLAISCYAVNEESDEESFGWCQLDASTGTMETIHEIASFHLGQCVCISGLTWNENETLLAYTYDPITRGFLSHIIVLDIAGNNHRYIGDGDVFDWKPGSNELTTIVGNGEIRTYNAETSELVTESKPFTASINEIALRPTSDEIASSAFGYEQDTLIWSMDAPPFEPRLTIYIELAGHVDYTSNEDELIAGGTIVTDIVFNQNVDAFDPDTGEFIRDVESFYDQGASPPSRYWNSNYTEYVEVKEDGTALLPNGISIETANNLEYVAWSPDQTTIATVERYPDDYSFNIRTWNTATGDYINTFASGMFAFQGLVWSPDSKHIAVLLEHPTGSSVYVRGLRVFSVIATENYEFDRHDYEVFADVDVDQNPQQAQAAWNSMGTLLAVALPGIIEIHSLQGTGALVTLPAYRINDLEWSEDDRFVAGGSEDGTIYVWGVSSG